MIAILLNLAAQEKYPYVVEVKESGLIFPAGRAQITTVIDAKTEHLTKTLLYKSTHDNSTLRKIEVFDREGRLVRSLTGETFAGEEEVVTELKKVADKWSLTVRGEKRKDDFPVAITDPSVFWCLSSKPKQGAKIEVQRFNDLAKVDTLNAVFHGSDEIGLKVERWCPGFREVTWHGKTGQVVRQEITHPPLEAVLIYRLDGLS